MAHPIDIYVGQKVRARRRALGLTQQHLANEIGIKFQQVQKYETGANRISASKLWEIFRILHSPISYFFEGYGDENLEGDTRIDGVDIKELTRLVRVFRKLDDHQRNKFFQLAQTLLD